MIKIGSTFLKDIFLGSTRFYFFIFLIAGQELAYAKAQIQVQATVDRNSIALSDTITATVAVKSTESVDIQEPKLNDLQGFELVNQWNSNSVRSSFVNGKMAHEVTKSFNYTLVPRKTGVLTLGSFEVVVDGDVYHTEPISIDVSTQGSPGARQKPSQKQQRQNPWPQGFDEESEDPFQQLEEEMFNQLLQRRGLGPGLPNQPNSQNPQVPPSRKNFDPQLRTLPTNPDEAFFVQVEVDKLEVFENEQITVNWYLYTRGQLESLDRVKFPDLKGFWKEIIEEIPQLQFTEEIINGVVYRKALLASHALFPIKAGTSYIDEYKIKSRMRLPVSGLGFGFGKSYEYQRTSKKVSIKVNPLPQEGRPENFSGAVGQFQVHAKVEAQQFPVNQPFSFKIRFEGEGNAKLIELPAIKWPEGVEVYDTKSDAKFFKNGTSYKEFEILLIPRKMGTLEIPSIAFAEFNPRTKKYDVQKTETLTIQISDNPNAPSVNISNRLSTQTKTAEPTTKTTPQIPALVTNYEANPAAESLWHNPMMWIGLFGSIFVSLFIKAQKEFEWGIRSKTLKEKLRDKLKKAKSYLNKNDFRPLAAEVCNSYYFVLGALSPTASGDQEIQKLLDQVSSSIRRDFGQQILQNYEYFQTLAFAPEEMLGNLKQNDSLKKNYQVAEELLLKLCEVQISTHEKK